MVEIVPNGQDAIGVDIVFGLALLGTLFMIARRWRAFWDADFTVEDRRLATQAGFFVVTPIVVLIHELGHILGAAMVGGRVLGFHYGLVEGSVTVAGGLSNGDGVICPCSAGDGNLLGAAVGLAMAMAGAWITRLPRALRRMLIFGGMLEVLFQLVLYPLISISGRFGDWTAI